MDTHLPKRQLVIRPMTDGDGLFFHFRSTKLESITTLGLCLNSKYEWKWIKNGLIVKEKSLTIPEREELNELRDTVMFHSNNNITFAGT